METKENILNSFLNYLRYERQYSKHTILAYSKDVNNLNSFVLLRYGFLPLSGELEINKVTPEIIRAWFSGLKTSAPTKKRMICGVRAFFNHLIKINIVRHNPVVKIKLQKQKRRLPQFLSQDEVKNVFLSLSQDEYDFNSIRNRCVIELLYGCGLRCSELCNLTFQNVDLESRILRVLGKGNKTRLIPFTAIVENILNDYYLACKRENLDIKQGFLLKKINGNRFNNQSVYILVNKIMQLFPRLKQKSPHILRHSYATHLIENGAELTTVSSLLGHSSIISTQTYLHTSIRKLKDIYSVAHPSALRQKQ